MAKKRLSNSLRKHIRKEKARIRREILGLEEQKKLINQLYDRFLSKPRAKNIKKLKSEEQRRMKLGLKEQEETSSSRTKAKTKTRMAKSKITAQAAEKAKSKEQKIKLAK